MTTNRSKGFTIIELLVVIAIIAVLAAIVLVNVTAYINRARNAAIKGNLATVLINAAAHYDTNGSYDNFCASANYTVPAAAVGAAGGTVICEENTGNTAFCSCTTMNVTTAEPSGTTFCIDSNGTKKQTATACATECPAGAVALCV